jgi:small-conductance mechanosensitive channel
MGITWQIIVPLAGALGIGLGFGLQTVINNYICGFILLFSKKVRLGDFVELAGDAGKFVGVDSGVVFGKVISIDMFATTVKTYDNIEVMVPNSVFISETIINYTRSDKYVRVRIPVGVSYSSDIELVQKLMYETIEECEYVVKHRKQEVWFIEYGDSSLNFMALFWLNMQEGLQSAAVRNVFLQSLWHKFQEHDIEIPFPQQDVWFRNDLKIADNKENIDEI